MTTADDPDSEEQLTAIEVAVNSRRGIRSVVCPWPQFPDEPKYLVEVKLRDAGQRFVCVGIGITAIDPDGTVDSTVMRSINTGAVVREAIQRHHRHEAEAAALMRSIADVKPRTERYEVRQLDDEQKEEALNAAERASRRLGVSGEGNGRRYPPGHLEEVARITLEARRAAKPTAAAVAEAFGISKSAAANQISRARARGLLD